ncbi:hypothetical protein SDC9_109037 [bioreactor metagenome]|uniref:Uncharacterized protein n=1 Tax=bioreactor metagenome TaxID=1076179 RepID=A0A645BBY1_9ZZZZ
MRLYVIALIVRDGTHAQILRPDDRIAPDRGVAGVGIELVVQRRRGRGVHLHAEALFAGLCLCVFVGNAQAPREVWIRLRSVYIKLSDLHPRGDSGAAFVRIALCHHRA